MKLTTTTMADPAMPRKKSGTRVLATSRMTLSITSDCSAIGGLSPRQSFGGAVVD